MFSDTNMIAVINVRKKIYCQQQRPFRTSLQPNFCFLFATCASQAYYVTFSAPSHTGQPPGCNHRHEHVYKKVCPGKQPRVPGTPPAPPGFRSSLLPS